MKVYGIYGESLRGKSVQDMIPYQSIKQAKKMFFVGTLYGDVDTRTTLYLFRHPNDPKPRYELRWTQKGN